MMNFVTVKDSNLLLEGTVRLEEEKTDGHVTALWVTDGQKTYVIRGSLGAWLTVLEPEVQSAPPQDTASPIPLC